MIAPARPPLVVGLGYPDGGDDAVGLSVAARLSTSGIQAVQITDPAELVPLLAEVDRAVIIDAVAGPWPPGTVIHMRGATLARHAPKASVSSHGMSLAGALALARVLGSAADVHLVGIAIEPPHGFSPALSSEVAAAVDTAAARVQALIAGAD